MEDPLFAGRALTVEWRAREVGFLVMVLDSLPLLKVRYGMQMTRENSETCSPADDLLFLFITAMLCGY